MEILLIRPHCATGYRVISHPVGLAYLASFLELENHQVKILDLAIEHEWEKTLLNCLKQRSFQLTGISCMTIQFPGACRAARLIKTITPHMPVVIGGVHPTVLPQETIKHEFIDYVVLGEGEHTLGRVVQSLTDIGSLPGINGLAFKENGQIRVTLPQKQFPSLDELPFPAYHLLDLKRYFALDQHGLALKKTPAIQILTSRGCPYRCIFCHDLFGKGFRARSPENVVQEMQLLYSKYGVREFLVIDDNFAMDLSRAKKICDLLIDSGMDIALQFPNGIRADRMDEELMGKLKKAGAHCFGIGIESASPRVQKLIKKALDLKKVSEIIQLAKKYGIKTYGFFMLGFPTETKEEINETIRFARNSRLDLAFFNIVTPYPGTELMAIVKEKGYDFYLDEEKMDIMLPHIQTESFTFREIKWLHLKAYLLFYLKWRRLIPFFLSFTKPSELKKYLKGLNKYLLQNIRYLYKNPSHH